MSTDVNSTSGDTKWPLPTRYIVGVGLVLFFIFLLYISRAELSVIIMAGILAFLVRPIIHLLNRRLGWGVSVLLTYFAILIVLLLIPLILVPVFSNGVEALAGVDWSAAADNAKTWLENTLTNIQNTDIPVATLDDAVDSLVEPLLDALAGTAAPTTPAAPTASDTINSISQVFSSGLGAIEGIVGKLVAALASFALMFVFSIYMSMQADKFHPGILKAVPLKYRPEVDTLLKRLVKTWNDYLHGEVTLMIIIGTIVAIGNLLLGNSAWPVLGIISGLMEVVPGLGPLLALIPGVLVALIGGSSHLPVSNLVFALIVLVFYEGVQVFENNIIMPRVIGRSVELNPLVILVGMFVMGRMLGLAGAMLTVPLLASGLLIVGYLYRKTLGDEPFPPEDREAPPQDVNTAVA
jgi:predicted PurR-regulated permease PerM